MRLFAPAKLNLGLEVTGRRLDGLHDVVTVMETISLFDVIDLRPSSELQVRTDDHRIAPDDDLVRRAIVLIQEQSGVSLPLAVSVVKAIPIAAGLGGGSSDAGTIISTLGRMIGLTDSDMHRIAASLGADVPFFVHGGAALATGTGTDIERLPASGRRWYVVLVPNLEIVGKTAALYRSLEPQDFTDGRRTRLAAERLVRGQEITAELSNVFQRPLQAYPEFAAAKDILEHAAGKPSLAAGAGPAMFTVCSSIEEAKLVMNNLHQASMHAFIATSVRANINENRIIVRPSSPADD